MYMKARENEPLDELRLKEGTESSLKNKCFEVESMGYWEFEQEKHLFL